jgi:adenylate kinase
MTKKVILITGTPCTGKTTIAKQLATKLKAVYVNLTELAIAENLTLGKDKKRDTIIIDEKRIKHEITQIIKTSTNNHIIIDGHYAAHVVPDKLATHVFVLRRNPTELRKLMRQKNYTDTKLWENLAAEILDISLIDALNAYSSEQTCELDITGKTTEQNVTTILNVISGKEKCYAGIVDWIGKLETEGVLQDYLKI